MWRPGLVSIKKSSTLQSSTLEISPLYLGGEGEGKYWTQIYKAGEWRVLLWRFHHFILGERGEVRTGLESIKLESVLWMVHHSLRMCGPSHVASTGP